MRSAPAADEEAASDDADETSESSEEGASDGSPLGEEVVAVQRGPWNGPQAGCTAVAALVRGNSLYVANAGAPAFALKGVPVPHVDALT